MDSSKYSLEQWTEQQHAEAVESLGEASYYALVTVDKKGKVQLNQCSDVLHVEREICRRASPHAIAAEA
jgi:hypothetical protein